MFESLVNIVEQFKELKDEVNAMKKKITAQNIDTNVSNECDELNKNKNVAKSKNTDNSTPLKQTGAPGPNILNSTKFKRNRRVPPIVVSSEKCDQLGLLNKIQSADVDINSLKWFPAPNKNIRVEVNNMENYDKVHQVLKSNDIEMYTHAVKGRVKPIYIIKNLCKSFALNDIKADLNSQNFEILEISRFETKFHIENEIDSKMVKVILPENTDTKAFEKIRFILHMRVYIQTLKPSKILQCKRCQRLHHSATYCNFPYRCVKCTDGHQPGECKLNAVGNTVKPKCCDCGGEHIASSYKCKVIATEIEKSKGKKSQDDRKIFQNANRKVTANVNNASTSSGKSFAGVIRENYPQPAKPKPSKPTNRINILNNLKSCMLAMQQTIELLINENE